jgi:hypothetical protein
VRVRGLPLEACNRFRASQWRHGESQLARWWSRRREKKMGRGDEGASAGARGRSTSGVERNGEKRGSEGRIVRVGGRGSGESGGDARDGRAAATWTWTARTERKEE